MDNPIEVKSQVIYQVVTTERETLSDGSHVHNVIVKHNGDQGVRFCMSSEKAAADLYRRLMDRYDNNEILAIESI